MALWDVFHSDRLELSRGLSAEEVANGLASGAIRDDDLVRPSGTTVAWVRLVETPELLQPPTEPQTTPEPGPEASGSRSAEDLLSFPVLNPDPSAVAPEIAWPEDDFEEDDREEDDYEDQASGSAAVVPAAPGESVEKVVPSWDLTDDDLVLDRVPAPRSSHVALPVFPAREGEPAVEDEDEDGDGTFSLTRSGPARVEELDLAAMVDVAFQLVLFFLVTATTILYKTLEIPRPSSEAPPSAVAQGRSRTLDDLSKDYIVVEIDGEGNVRIDHEPVAARLEALAERLRDSREKTGRTTMLLSADFSTPHRNAVLAYDAANEVALGIAIAKPTPPEGPAPALKPTAKAPLPPASG